MAGTFTPSNLYLISMGSVNLHIARVNATALISGPAYWTSKIPSIISVIGNSETGASRDSGCGLMVSFTQTNGVVHVNRALIQSDSGITIWVASGGYGQDVQNRP